MPPLGLPKLSVEPVGFWALWLGTLSDAMGSGNGSVTGPPHWTQSGSLDGILSTVANGRIDVADAVQLRLTTQSWYLYSSAGFVQSGTQTLADKAVGNYRLQLLSDRMRLTAGGVDSDLVTVGFVGAKSIAVTLTTGGVPTFYADHVSLGAGDAALTPATGADALYLLGDGASPMLSPCEMVVCFAGALTVVDVTALDAYMAARFSPRKQWPGGGLRYPDRGDPYTPATGDPMFIDNIQSARVTLTNQTEGKLSNTDYTIQSGTWAVKEDATTGERYIECVVAGIISRRNLDAYGTWEFEIYKALDGGVSDIAFLTSQPSAVVAGAGYFFRLDNLERCYAGEIPIALKYVTERDYVAINTSYKIRVTRSSASVFTQYIKGGAYAEWTLIDPTGPGGIGTNPFTDATTTTSRYTVFDLDAGDRLYLDRQFEGVIAP